MTDRLTLARAKTDAACVALLNAKKFLDRAISAAGRFSAIEVSARELDRAESAASRADKFAVRARILAIEVGEITRGTEFRGTRRGALKILRDGGRIAREAAMVRKWTARERFGRY